MSLSLIAACLWVLACTVTAMLPIRRQYVPGTLLLLTAPALLAWLGYDHGAWAAGLGALALLSFFRKPLRFLAAKALSRATKRPDVL